MEVIYLYWAFSTLFVFGSAVEDSISGTKQSAFIYFVGILLSPLAIPYALGVTAAKSKDNDTN